MIKYQSARHQKCNQKLKLPMQNEPFQNSFVVAYGHRLLRADNNRSLSLVRKERSKGEKEMRAPLLALLYQGRRTRCYRWMGLLLSRIDIARIFNSFFFERQQCGVWKLDTIWVLCETPFSSPGPSCPYGIQHVQQGPQWHQLTGSTKTQGYISVTRGCSGRDKGSE